MYNLKEKPEIAYIYSGDKYAIKSFVVELDKVLGKGKQSSPIIVLCIGTDRVTGDSLGPLVGYKLKNTFKEGVFVYGTLDHPVHAKNLSATIDFIYSNYENPLVIAIDACLGRAEYIGYVTIGLGKVTPGAGAGKSLPSVGDISITGIVNYYSTSGNVILQNTRLSVVMQIADIVSEGIKKSLKASAYKKN